MLEGMLGMTAPEGFEAKSSSNNVSVDCAMLAPTLRSCCFHAVSQ